MVFKNFHQTYNKAMHLETKKLVNKNSEGEELKFGA
jgi:hypothetical protein